MRKVVADLGKRPKVTDFHGLGIVLCLPPSKGSDRLMPHWVKATQTTGTPIFINLDNVTALLLDVHKKETTVFFVEKGDSIYINETPEELLKGLGQ
jgi:hypothetical protein